MNSSLTERLRVRPHFRWTIASALTLSIVLVIVLLMGLVTYMDIRRERALFRESLEQRGVLLASSLNDILANHMYFAEADELRDIAKVVTSQPEIEYFRIFKPDGRLLVSEPRDYGQSEYPTGYVEEDSRSVIIQEGQPVPQFQDHTGQVVSPIMSGRDLLGVVHFGFNADARDAEIRSIILEHLLQALTLIVLGVALAYLIARNLSRSIGALATVAREIGRGNLDVIVPSRGTREAVELSDSLERMRAELQALYGGLEQRVAQRTQDLSRTTEELKAEIAERQQAEEEARRLAAENQLVAEVGRIITSSLDIDDVYQRFAARIRAHVPFDYMSISLSRLEDKVSISAYVSGIDVPGRRAGDEITLEGTLTEAVIRRRSSILIQADNVEELARQYPGLVPALDAGLRSFLSVPLITGDEVIGILHVRSAQQNVYSNRELGLMEQVGRQIAPAIENARLFEEANSNAEEMTVVDQVARIITTNLNIQQVYDQFASEVNKLVAFDRIYINLVDQNAGSSSAKYIVGVAEEGLEVDQARPLPGTQSEVVVKTGESLVRCDIAEDPRFNDDHTHLAFGLRSAIALPLISKGVVIGTLGLRSREVGAYGAREQVILERLAAQIAPAVENALLYEQLKEGQERLRNLSRQLVEVQEQERRHVARELHDEIGQLLTGLKLTLEVIPRLSEDAGKAKVEQAKTMVNELMVQVRELSLDLRPAMLDDLGLLPTLLWYFERFTARTQVKVFHEHAGLDQRFRPEVETTAYRIVQEALTNVARHADTGAVTVRIRSDQDNLLMEIHDHGAGFDPDAVLVNPHSNGLYGMRERAILLGGQLTLEAAPGDGTRLIAELPLADWPVGDGDLTNEKWRENDGDSTGG